MAPFLGMSVTVCKDDTPRNNFLQLDEVLLGRAIGSLPLVIRQKGVQYMLVGNQVGSMAGQAFLKKLKELDLEAIAHQLIQDGRLRTR